MKGRDRLLVSLLLVLGLGSCLQYDLMCGGCVDKLTEPPPVPFERVGPCTLRYHDEPKEPGFPNPHINGLASMSFEFDPEHHLITFPYCHPDAGLQGTVEVFWIYNTHVEH